MRPVIGIDVDGVLNALGPLQDGWEEATRLGYPIRYSQWHGARLVDLAEEHDADLVWCTTWEERANDLIAPLVGLPQLPVIPLAPGRAGMKFSESRPVGHIKAVSIARWNQAGAPFLWLDDEPDAAEWLSPYSFPHQVIRVEPLAGLQPSHLELARSWLARLSGG